MLPHRRRRPLRALMLVLLVLAGVALVGGSSALGDDEKDRPPRARYSGEALATTNLERRDHGRSRLDRRPCLHRFAASHAERLARSGSLAHQELEPILRACDLTLVGENVAAGFPDGESVVEEGWMRSSSHRANVLEPRFELTAMATRRGADGRWYVVQLLGQAS